MHQEFQASQEALDPRDQQVLRDHPVIMDLKDPWAHEETKVMKELVENREHQASKELKDLQARQVHVGTKVKQVQLVLLETRVIQVLVESKVPLVPRDLKDRQVQLVPLETRVIKVLVEVKGPPGPKGAPGSFGRNWKQCVFKNLNDGRDSGLIKVTTELN